MRETLEKIFSGGALTEAEAYAALSKIASGMVSRSEIAAFLTCYRLRPPETDEMRGFRRAMLDASIAIDLAAYDPIDIVGTGGDGKNTFNISTLSSFVVAGAGQRVAKHGNYSASSVCGSSNVLERLGIRFSCDRDVLRRSLEDSGVCFLHAPLFHPAMKHVAPVRKELGVRTFFNLLGPLLNPCRPRAQLVGANSMEAAELIAAVLGAERIRYAVVHSHDGYDEISLTGPFSLLSGGAVVRHQPSEFGFMSVRPEDLSAGGSVETAAKLFVDILEGRGTPAQESVVAANAGAALACAFNSAFSESIERARESLRSKRALQAFKKAVELSA